MLWRWIESFIDVPRRERGRELERGRLLLALLRVRFGDSPDVRAVVERLTVWDDQEAAIAAITTATDPRALLELSPPGPAVSTERVP